MSTLYFMQGIPASGKSTYAKTITNAVRVNRDLLREMLHNNRWSKDNEKITRRVRDLIVNDSLAHGMNVIVDDTNLEWHMLNDMMTSADPDIDVKVVSFYISLEEALLRDASRTPNVGEKVVRDFARRHPEFVLDIGSAPYYTETAYSFNGSKWVPSSKGN